MEWNAIAHSSNGFDDGNIANAAQMSDFEQLYLSKNLNFGYGVLYADGATDTQQDVSEAYGYYRRNAKSDGSSPRGMRGLFVYYLDGMETGGSTYNAKNIFFPIGRSGYGHRKDKKEGAGGNLNGDGILRYACSRGDANTMFSNVGPLFVSIYRRPGAIYWAKQSTNSFLGWDGNPDSGTAYGLDINYFSFDVNAITGSNISNGADACFVRCVGNTDFANQNPPSND